MASLYPLAFTPIFKERVWGGRRLEGLYDKPLPPGLPIGESWEISDRPEDVSVIVNGPLAGKDLHWLVENRRTELLGNRGLDAKRFPLLIKILDARQTLSLQVHPPPSKASALGGESKTEMWYVAEAEPGAELFVGLRRGVTRRMFEQKIEDGQVAECFHRVSVKAGDAMYLPSGRVHAIGSGLVLFEIQQNSDTTYRVFDWNRAGLDGKPRPLHQRESLSSIDFEDFEPGLVDTPVVREGSLSRRVLTANPLFQVEEWHLEAHANHRLPVGRMEILGVVKGKLEVGSQSGNLELIAGCFCLLPAGVGEAVLRAEETSTVLTVEAG